MTIDAKVVHATEVLCSYTLLWGIRVDYQHRRRNMPHATDDRRQTADSRLRYMRPR